MGYLTAPVDSNKLTIKHVSSNGIKNNEILNFALSVNQINSDTAVAIDNWARQFVALSKDSYTDSEIKTTKTLEYIARGDYNG